MWFILALGSAVFAALTSILAKVGIDGFVQVLLIGAVNSQDIALDLQDHVGMEGVGKGALGALDGDHIALGNVHGHICRNDNRLLTNS